MSDEEEKKEETAEAATEETKAEESSSDESNDDKKEEGSDEASKAELDTLTEGDIVPKNQENMDVILEIPVRISMEIGFAHLSIRNLLKLSQGSIVELDKFAGDPLDVFVNGTLIAHGEVVVVNEKFGIRLTDVISQTERIQKLGETA